MIRAQYICMQRITDHRNLMTGNGLSGQLIHMCQRQLKGRGMGLTTPDRLDLCLLHQAQGPIAGLCGKSLFLRGRYIRIGDIDRPRPIDQARYKLLMLILIPCNRTQKYKSICFIWIILAPMQRICTLQRCRITAQRHQPAG